MMEMSTKKALIAIDGSEQAAQAFEWYFSHLHRPENTVILVHVPEGPTVTTSEGMYLNAGEIHKMMEKEKEETKNLQHKYLSKLADKHTQALYKTFYGKPGESIVKAAHELEVSLVIMGTRGLGKLRRTLVGSVSDFVVHHAHCPVVVCRH